MDKIKLFNFYEKLMHNNYKRRAPLFSKKKNKIFIPTILPIGLNLSPIQYFSNNLKSKTIKDQSMKKNKKKKQVNLQNDLNIIFIILLFGIHQK